MGPTFYGAHVFLYFNPQQIILFLPKGPAHPSTHPPTREPTRRAEHWDPEGCTTDGVRLQPARRTHSAAAPPPV